MDNFSKEDLEEALPAMASMISRSEKVQKKLKEGTPQSSLTKNRLKALHISSSLITRELNKDFIIENFTKEDLEKALPPITSTISKCEKAQNKLKEGTPSSSLIKNMLNALYISLSLITNELNK